MQSLKESQGAPGPVPADTSGAAPEPFPSDTTAMTSMSRAVVEVTNRRYQKDPFWGGPKGLEYGLLVGALPIQQANLCAGTCTRADAATPISLQTRPSSGFHSSTTRLESPLRQAPTLSPEAS